MPLTIGTLKGAALQTVNGFVDAALVAGGGPSWVAPGRNIGVPHAKRVVVLAIATGDTTASPISGVTIGGVPATLAARSSGSGAMRACAVYYRHMPTGVTADIKVTNNNNASQCFIGIYAIYPAHSGHIDGGAGNGSSTGATASGLVAQAGGICIAATHHRNTNHSVFGGTLGGAWVTNWNDVVGGGANGAVGMKVTDGSGATASVSWTGSVNGSIAAALWGPM
jgi:hypothetical protein